METLKEILGQEIPSPSAIRSVAFEPEPRINELSPAAKIARNMEIYHRSPWAMVEDECIYTNEETNLLYPVKPLPNQPWLKEIANIWLDEPLIALFKSRRMIITWTMVFLHLWLAMFREGAAIFFVSDKEDKSNELIDRAEFIYNHLPMDMFLKPRAKRTYCNFEFPGLNSNIQGV